MNKRSVIVICFIFACLLPVIACTSAIIGADMNPYGRPLLWKNRDTGNVDNKIEYIPGKGNEFSYVALFNANDSLLREAWIGMNEYGFAIMNTASYNLKDDDVPPTEMDKEGLLMSEALKKCKTVKDFEVFLDSIKKPMGVEANFGVIDAYGTGAYFETNNYSTRPYYLDESPDHVLIRTNYSHSGRDNEGFGFVREKNARQLLQPYIKERSVSPDVLTEDLSRSFYHSLIDEDFADNSHKWVIDQDFIPRYTSTATIVIEGCHPLKDGETLSPDFLKRQYIMWTGLGYPPCSDIFPVFCTEDGVDPLLKGSKDAGRSPQCDVVLKRKQQVFPITKGNGNKYIDMHTLYNKENNGFVQTLVPSNIKTYERARALRDSTL